MISKTSTVFLMTAALTSSASAAYMDPDGFALRSGKKMTLNDRSTVIGSIGATENITMRSGATVSGDVFGNASGFTISSPSFPSSYNSNNVLVDWDASESFAPGVYGSFTARDRTTVNFTAGDYVFKSFDLGNDSTFNVDTSAGDVNIYVVGNTTLKDRSLLANLGNNDVFIMSEQHVSLGHDTNVTASIYAFDGKVTIGDRADVFGHAYSFKDLTLGHDSSVNFVGSTFGESVPAPGVASLAVLAGACAFRRRR